jgi:rubrerythrin
MNARRDTPFLAWNRRQFLRASGLTVVGGGILAACGPSNSGEVPRIGTVPPTTALVDEPVTDVVLLRTATSLEYNALYVYESVASLGVLDELKTAITERFAQDHGAHAEATAALTTQLGGEPYRCPNPRLQSIYVEPAMRLILGSKAAADLLGIEEPDGAEIPESTDALTDILVLADALESLAAATYQALVPAFNDKALRAEAMRIGAQEAQHASLLGTLINPTQLIAVDGVSLPPSAEPATTTTAPAVGLPTTVAGPDTTEAPAVQAVIPIFAVPTTFGSLAPIQVQLGAPNEADIRATVNLETPSLNALMYEYIGAC